MSTTLQARPPSPARPSSVAGTRRRRAWAAVLLLVVFVLAVTLARDARQGVPLEHAVGSGVAAAGPLTANPPASLRQDAVIAMVLPVSGPEARWTQGLDRFVSALRYAAVRTCVQSHRVPMPLIPPPLFIRFYDIPDLDYIRSHGFSDQVKDPVPHRAASPATKAVQDRCLAAAKNAADLLLASYATVHIQWMREISSMQADPDIVQAYRMLPTCLAGRGVHAGNEQDFFAVLADRSRRFSGGPRAAREVRELAGDYAACMAPIEAVRVAKRIVLREGFLTRHAPDIQTLELSLPAQIRQLERTTGIQITFPV